MNKREYVYVVMQDYASRGPDVVAVYPESQLKQALALVDDIDQRWLPTCIKVQLGDPTNHVWTYSDGVMTYATVLAPTKEE